MGTESRTNTVLEGLLAELNWSPGHLAAAVNRVLGAGYVARSTVSDWMRHNRLPRDPVPTVVTHLIGDALDRKVTVEQVWSGRAQPAQFGVPANHGLALPWTVAGTVEVIDDWLRHTGGSIGMDRRVFLAVSGASLTAPAWAYVDHLMTPGGSFAALADARHSITVTNVMVDAIAATTAGLRNLGNTEGGCEDNLRVVHHHLIWVAKLLRQARFTSAAVANRLLSEWAQLAQLATWLANDAGEHGLAQRFFFSSLHAAHTANDRSVGAYLLACTTQHVIHRGRLADGIDLSRAARDAVEIGNAACDAAKSAPPVVRAIAAGSFAQAQASVGNARGFHTAADEARTLLATPGALDDLPPYLTWFWPPNLESCLAQGALILTTVSSRDSRSLRALLECADTALGGTATDPDNTARNAVFHTAWLARAHLATDDLDRAAHTGLLALRRLPGVRSRRCALLLRRLHDDLTALPQTRRPAAIRALHDQLRATPTT